VPCLSSSARTFYDSAADTFRDECGVYGVVISDSNADAAPFVALGLHALQHRGQEAAGIASYEAETKRFNVVKHHGYVRDSHYVLLQLFLWIARQTEVEHLGDQHHHGNPLLSILHDQSLSDPELAVEHGILRNYHEHTHDV
jgi:glucosamine 6-phosphate synthetase-like amidotransferase/phosphosugar isomerase protein